MDGAFFLSSLVVILAPGPDAALVSGYVLQQGRRPARAAAAGILTGGVVHGSLTVLGLSAVFASPGASAALRMAGAIALCLLGARTYWRAASTNTSGIMSPEPAHEPSCPPTSRENRSMWAAYASGLACNLLNPKVLVFLVAFLPQFAPAATPSTASLAALAVSYLAMAACWLGVLIELVFQLRARLLRPRDMKRLELLAAAVLLAIGLHMAIGA